MSRPLQKQLFAQRIFRQVLFGLIIMSFVLGILVAPLENGVGNISSLWDGLWWSTTTVTGVGYGDVYPVTPLGRLIGVVLEIMGVLSFGLVVGLIANALHRREDDVHHARESERFNDISQRLDRIEKKIEFMVKDNHESTGESNPNH